MRSNRVGVTNTVYASSVIVLIVIAAVGYVLYAMSSGTASSTVTSTTMVVSTSEVSHAVSALRPVQTGGFYNGSVVTFTYPYNYKCTPALTTFFPNQTAAAAQTGCEVGAGNSAGEQGAVPLWVMVPAYAGLSIFGVSQLGASPLGFAAYNNQTIVTQCGASDTPSGCPDHPSLLYSPFFTAVEQHLGIKGGYGGLPEGVLPTPAHDHLINCCFEVVPWYTVVVLVFDPNIFPNAVTGECVQVASSNVTDSTSNCLSNFNGLTNALTTHDSGVAAVNAKNPIWQTLGGPTTQVVIPGVATSAQISNANSNLFEHFTVNGTNYYLPCSNGNLSACK